MDDAKILPIFSFKDVFYLNFVAKFYSGLVTYNKDINDLDDVPDNSDLLIWRFNRVEYATSKEELGKLIDVPFIGNKDIYQTTENLSF